MPKDFCAPVLRPSIFLLRFYIVCVLAFPLGVSLSTAISPQIFNVNLNFHFNKRFARCLAVYGLQQQVVQCKIYIDGISQGQVL